MASPSESSVEYNEECTLIRDSLLLIAFTCTALSIPPIPLLPLLIDSSFRVPRVNFRPTGDHAIIDSPPSTNSLKLE
jgi:hypothetical protein